MNFKKIAFLALIIYNLNGFAQIKFESGYYIDNGGNKTACLIKNEAWNNNPESFAYKLNQTGQVMTANLKTITEFGVPGVFKYKRFDVMIDRLSDNVNDLGKSPTLDLKQETLFLKLLTEGKASLYFYEAPNIRRFYYDVNGSEIRLLGHKKYISDSYIRENNIFRQEIFTNLKCENLSIGDVENLEYTKDALLKIFSKYNSCFPQESTTLEQKKENFQVNLHVKAGINSANLSLENYYAKDVALLGNIDFDNNVSFSAGIEAEFIMPFNKNKWAIFLEPTYQYFKSDKQTATTVATVDYKAIEIPAGIRHYFFLTDKSKLFVNAAFVYAIVFDSEIVLPKEYYRHDLETASRINYNLGFGYVFNDRYRLEFKYRTTRDVFRSQSTWLGEFKGFGVLVGYRFL